MKEEDQRKHILDWERDLNRGNIRNTNVLQHWIRYIAALKHIKPGDKVLEVGFGNAYLPRMLYTNQIHTEYVGIDYDRKNLEKALKHSETPKWCYGDETLIYGRFGTDDCGLGDQKFDVIYTSHVIEHMPKEEGIRFLLEAHKHLRVGGKFLIACPDGAKKDLAEYHLYEWSIGELRDFFAYFGYEEEGVLSCENSVRTIEEKLENIKYSRIREKYYHLKKLIPNQLLVPVISLFMDDELEDIFLFMRKKEHVEKSVPAELLKERVEGPYKRKYRREGYFR